MGQTPEENIYGTCPTCDWDPWSPSKLTVLIEGVHAPTVGGFDEPPNGLHTMKAVSLCKWVKLTSCYQISFELGMITRFIGLAFQGCNPAIPIPFFIDETQNHCAWEFTNQTAPPPSLNYHDGTAFVTLNLKAPGSWIPAAGMLPATGWKYESQQAENGNEQIYIGSRKYKTNCRILYNPDELP